MTNELQGVHFVLERIEKRQKLIEAAHAQFFESVDPAALEVLRPKVFEPEE